MGSVFHWKMGVARRTTGSSVVATRAQQPLELSALSGRGMQMPMHHDGPSASITVIWVTPVSGDLRPP